MNNTQKPEHGISKGEILEAKLAYHGKLFKISLICSFAYLFFWTLLTIINYFAGDPDEISALYTALSFLIYTVTIGIIFVSFLGAFLNLRREIRKRFSSSDKIFLTGIYFLIQFSGVLYILLILESIWWGLSGLVLLILVSLYFYLKKTLKAKALEKLGE